MELQLFPVNQVFNAWNACVSRSKHRSSSRTPRRSAPALGWF